MKNFKSLFLASMMLFASLTFAASAENVNRVMNSVDKTTESVTNVGKASINGVSTVYQDSKTLLNTAHDDAKSLSSYLGVRLDSLTAKSYKLADKGLGNLWDIIVKQARVVSFTLLFLWIISFISLIRLFKVFSNNPINTMNPLIATIRIVWCIIAVSGCCIGFVNSVDIFTGIFNPEYAAIKDITTLIQQNLSH